MTENAYFCNMSGRESGILYFVAFCIESYKNRHGLSGTAVSQLFDQYGVKEYLAANYDVLHTQGMQWLLEEIEEKIGR